MGLTVRDGVRTDRAAAAIGNVPGTRVKPGVSGSSYHSGDVASRDEDGYIFYIGRTDDVFKDYDYKISPFELESVLIEHPAVAEAAVVPRRTS
ncbi:hypothetical protein [Nocardioides sp. NPDC006273]|uniref:hypothetical protein n=1 Tax=Nocardioides sp. NPDC006273 TaxID=3155598 RepID=UPI0033A8552B